jgi:hypothetical protein
MGMLLLKGVRGVEGSRGQVKSRCFQIDFEPGR